MKRPGLGLVDRVARKTPDSSGRGADGSHGKLPPRPKVGGGVKTTQEEPDKEQPKPSNLPDDQIVGIVEASRQRLADLTVSPEDADAAIERIIRDPLQAKRLVQEAFLAQFGAPTSWATLGLSDAQLLQMVEDHFTAGLSVAVPEVGPDATEQEIEDAAKALKELEESGKTWKNGVETGDGYSGWFKGHVIGKGNLPGSGPGWADASLGGHNPFEVYEGLELHGLPHTEKAIEDIVDLLDGTMTPDEVIAKKNAGGYPEPDPTGPDGPSPADNNKGGETGTSTPSAHDDPTNPMGPGSPTPGTDGDGDTGFQDAAMGLAGATLGAIVNGIKWLDSIGKEPGSAGFTRIHSKGDGKGGDEFHHTSKAATKEELAAQEKEDKEKHEKEQQEKEQKEKEKQQKQKEKQQKEEEEEEEEEDAEQPESDQPKENEYTPGPDGPGISPKQHARWMKSVGADKVLRIRLDTETFDTKNGSKDSTPNPVGETYAGSAPEGPGDINKNYVDMPNENQLTLELVMALFQLAGWKDGNGNGVIDYGPDHAGGSTGGGGGEPVTDVAGDTAAGDGDGEVMPTPPKSSSSSDDDDDGSDEGGPFADDDDSEYVEIG